MAGVGRMVSVHIILRGRLEDKSAGMQWLWLAGAVSWRFHRNRRLQDIRLSR